MLVVNMPTNVAGIKTFCLFFIRYKLLGTVSSRVSYSSLTGDLRPR